MTTSNANSFDRAPGGGLPPRISPALSVRKALLAFVLGALVAFGVQWLKAATFDGQWGGLLAVGQTSDLAPFIKSQLGNVPLWDGIGHDGQISFALARDPFGRVISSSLDDAGYRYRRILYPALSGLGGWLDPHATLIGLIVVAAFGVGLAAAGAILLAETINMRPWLPILVTLNPGVWLGAQLLTSDALALGLAVLGIALAHRTRWISSAVLFALAALTKDQYAICALAVTAALFVQRQAGLAWRFLAYSIGPLLVWGLIVGLRFGVGTHSSLDFPFVGLWESSTTAWPHLTEPEPIYLGLGLASWLAAWVGAFASRDEMLRWLCLSWAILGTISSHFVWDLGNNAARTLVMAGVVGMAALATARARPSSQR